MAIGFSDFKEIRQDKKDSNEKKPKVKKVSRKDIAVIGICLKFPDAENVHEFWGNLKGGLDSTGNIPYNRKKDVENFINYIREDSSELVFPKLSYLNEIDKFDYNFFNISPKEAALMDPNQRMFLETAWNALEDAGYGSDKLNGSKTGVYVGFAGVCAGLYQRAVIDIDPESEVMALPGNLPQIIASRISYALNLKGPALLIDTACSSSLVAVHYACRAIRYGECDMAIAGGISIKLMPVEDGEKVGVESSDGSTRPFDDNSDGTGAGEGVAAIILKPLYKAVEDRDSIYAVIKGSAVNQDGNSNGITAPNPEAQEEVIISAWEDAEVDPLTVSYIETHGTGTILGDPIEIDGITRAFGRFTKNKQICAIGSVKSNIGHLDSTAGLAGLIKAIMALKNCEIPASLHFQIPNSKINFINSPVYINTMLRKWEVNSGARRCGVSSFSLGGTNCHVVMEEAPAQMEESSIDVNEYNILTLSARKETALKTLVKEFSDFAAKNRDVNVKDLCYTANTGRSHFEVRIAIVFKNIEDLIKKLEKLKDKDYSEISETEVFYGAHKVYLSKEKAFLPFGITESEKNEFSLKAQQRINELLRTSTYDINILKELCLHYVRGADIKWQDFYFRGNPKKINIPAYPFEKLRCWLEIPQYDDLVRDDNLYYNTLWVEKEIDSNIQNNAEGKILLIWNGTEEDHKYTEDLVKTIKNSSRSIIEVEFSEKFEKINDSKYRIGYDIESTRSLFESIKIRDFSQIICLSDLKSYEMPKNNDDFINIQVKAYSIIDIIKVLSDMKDRYSQLEFVFVSNYVNEVTGNEKIIKPHNALLFGLGKIVGLENIQLKVRCIDIDDSCCAKVLFQEIDSHYSQYITAYRDGKRYEEEISKFDISKISESEFNIKQDGCYVITGGWGVLGIEMCKFIASKARTNIVLINRSKMPDRTKWDSILDQSKDDKLVNAIQGIINIEQQGSKIVIMSADVTKENELKQVLDTLRKEFGRINGVFHCAATGVGKEQEVLEDISKNTFLEMLAPKVQGTWIIDKLTKEDKLDFFVLFSSVITVVGGYGAGDYTAANAYLDSFAAYRKKNGEKVLAINWPTWDYVLSKRDKNSIDNKHMFSAISADEAKVALNEVMRRNISRLVIGRINYYSDLVYILDNLPFKFSKHINREIRNTKNVIVPNQMVKKAKNISLSGREDNAYTATEKDIAKVWGEILGLENINIYDNFFEIGGDSIIAMRIVNLLNELKYNVDVTEFLRYPSIKAFSDNIDLKNLSTKDTNLENEILPIEKSDYYPISSAQKRLHILQELEPSSTAYNMPGAMIIEGALDEEKVEECINALIKRHESLRTSFDLINGEYVQIVHESIKFKIEKIELKDSDFESQINTVEKMIKPFDLKKAPLIRATIIKVSLDKHILVFDAHHIISDGSSMEILFKEFAKIYTGRELKEIDIQFKDYVCWQKKMWEDGAKQMQESYWLDCFKGEVPYLNLPYDFIKTSVQSFDGEVFNFKLDRNQTFKLKSLAADVKGTLYMVMLAAYNVLLYKYTSQQDIVVGIPISARRHKKLEDVFGMFVNTLAIRNYPKNDIYISEFISNVRDNMLKAYENQDYQFEDLIMKLGISGDRGSNPLFDTMFTLHNGISNKSIEINDLKFSSIDFEKCSAKFDISLDAFEENGEINLAFTYRSELFRKETVERMAVHFKNIIEIFCANEDIKLSEIDYLSKKEKEKLIYGFNNTAAKYPKEKTLQRIFEEQAIKTPDSTAIIFEDKSFTYKELNSKANALARVLKQNGVDKGSIVGIMLKRSFDMIIGIMAILKAGGAYLPVDPDYPLDRKRFIFEDSGLKIVLTTNRYKSLADGLDTNVLLMDEPLLYERDCNNLEIMINSSNLAYIIYTSGSTGKPKGTMIEHYSALNRLFWMQKKYPLGKLDVILQKTPFTFDVSVWELFWWTFSGAKVCFLEPEGEKEPLKIIDAIEKNSVTVMHFVPSMLSVFMEYIENYGGVERLKSLRYVFSSGEALAPNQVLRFNKTLGGQNGTKLINLYGPTEATVDVSYFDCPSGDEVEIIPIGKPIDNIKLYIVDKNLNLQPVGVPGELCIVGDGVARGYLNRQMLTLEKFVSNPFSKFDGYKRMYRTGDLAKWRPDGNIEFLGRIDHQVKIRGFRVELAEVELKLLQHSDIKEAAVIVEDDKSGQKFLSAFVNTSSNIEAKELIKYLSNELPEYMIPSKFVLIDKLPLNKNGKLDRKALLQIDGIISTGTEYVAPSNELEEKLIYIWKGILGVDQIGIEHSFFEIGGHSLNATILISKIHKELNVEVPLKEVFNNNTVRKLAKYIRGLETSRYVSIGKVEEKEYYPLSSAQKRLYIINSLEANDIIYNMPTVVQIEGCIDIKKLEEAFISLIRRHESLRTSFVIVEEEPSQKILKDFNFKIEYLELEHDLIKTEKERIIDKVEEFIKPFDLSNAPLFRAGIIKLGEDRHVLMFDVHHIVSDGTSRAIIINDLLNFYEGNELEDLRLQYKDFSQWQNSFFESEGIKKQEKYWMDKFFGRIPVLNIPTDYERPANFSFRGDRVFFDIDKVSTDKLKHIANENGCTLYMVVLSAFYVLLYKYTGQSDILVGTGIAGRRHPDLENIIGMFVNTLVMRNYPKGEQTIGEFIEEVSKNAFEAYDNQDYQFEELVDKLELDRDSSRNPLFDVLFILQNMDSANVDSIDFKVEPFEFDFNTSKFDISMYVFEVYEGLEFQMEYCIDLFKRSTIETMAEDYKRIIGQLIDNLNIKIEDIDLERELIKRDSVIDEDIDFEF